MVTVLALLFVIDLFALQAHQDVEQAVAELRRSEAALAALRPLPQAVNTMRSGMRDYILTGNKAFLADYREASERFAEQARQALALVGDNEEQRQRLELAVELTGKWLANHLSPLVVRRLAAEGNLWTITRTIQIMRAGAGEAEFDRIRFILEQASQAQALQLTQVDVALGSNLEKVTDWMLARAVALILALSILVVIFTRMLNRLSGVRSVLAGQVRSREAAERAVRSNEAVLQSMNDAAPMGMFVTDEAGACTYANVAFERISGLIGSAIRGDGWQNALHPDDRDRVVAAWRSAIADRSPFASEHRFLHRKGRVVWVAMTATTMIEGKQPIGLVCMVQDLTALRDATDNLRRSHERLQIALGSSKLGLLDWHLPSGEVVLDGHWGLILGERNEQTTTTARRLSELIHADDREDLRQQLIGVLKGKSASLEARFRARTSDGQWKTLTCHGRVTERDNLGRAIQFAGTFSESVAPSNQFPQQLVPAIKT